MFRKALILGILFPIAVLIIKLAVVGFSHIEFSEFKPVMAVFLLDTSASNRELLEKQQQCVLRMAKRLDSEDHAKIYIVSEDAYEVYDGAPHKLSAMRDAIKKRSGFDAKAYGTAYGTALKKAVGDSLRYKAEGYTPAIILLGDMENEGAINKQINWSTLPKNLKYTLKYAPDLSLTFLYAHPQKLDEIRQTLVPVLGEKQLIISSEENIDQALRKFSSAIGR
ncbi:MAG: VWA domain-containing protein [Candidatus Gastranaerophilales bacterium]|nr:VWA domain-containing protein [Candidatus Gastranaerophilales bacterium]